jgi:hypothetical protein
MTPDLFIDTISVKRRKNTTSASLDILNNPIYGDPTTWDFVYTNIKARLLWGSKKMIFAETGELISPNGTCYIPANIKILPQDRIITVDTPGYSSNIEYVCESVIPGFSMLGGPIAFYEVELSLPISN